MRKLYTVRQFAEANPAFSEASLRWLIFNSEPKKLKNCHLESNGLAESGAILRNGRRILIDPERFDAWLRSRQHPAHRAA